MSIEFHCPGCGNLMGTPDETSGRKGRCPHCGVKVRIPKKSLTSAGPAESSPITPNQPSGMEPAAAKWKTAQPRPAPTPSQASGADSLEFVCPSCKQHVKVSASAAGKKGQCPHCQAVVRIPSGPGPSADQPTARPLAPASSSVPTPMGTSGLTPLGDSGLTPLGKSGPTPTGRPTPLGNSGLTPMGNSGLTPLGNSGLTPLNSGLTPLGESGLTPLGPTVSPFGSSAPANLFSEIGSLASEFPAANPYATPLIAAAPRPKRSFDDSKRRGLPWEIPDAENAFFDTVGKLLNTMGEAFSDMKCSGGFFKPLGFAFISNILVMGATIALALLLLGFLLVVGWSIPPQFKVDTVQAFLIAGAFVLLYLGSVLVTFVVSTFVMSGLIHLVLLTFGQANRSFETTYRVHCYAEGTVSLLLLPLALIPVVGPLVGLVILVVLKVRGLVRTHDSNTAGALTAVLMPYVVLVVLAIGLNMFA